MKTARWPPTPAFRGQVLRQRHYRPQQLLQASLQEQEARPAHARTPRSCCNPPLPPLMSMEEAVGGGRQRVEIEEVMTSTERWVLTSATTASADALTSPVFLIW